MYPLCEELEHVGWEYLAGILGPGPQDGEARLQVGGLDIRREATAKA